MSHPIVAVRRSTDGRTRTDVTSLQQKSRDGDGRRLHVVRRVQERGDEPDAGLMPIG
jgi:hypothetical protein